MRGNTDMTNIDEQGTYKLAPAGEHIAVISEVVAKESTNGDPMINIKLVITSDEGRDCIVWDNILIPEPDSPSAKILGRTKHFLHCIGEPYADKIVWDSADWVLKNCKIKVEHEEPNSYHKYPKAIVGMYILDEGMAQEDNEVPF